MRVSFSGRWLAFVVLFSGMVALSMLGCHSSFRMSPLVPALSTATSTATSTSTATFACTYATTVLPGTYNGVFGTIIETTPTVTPTPAPSLGSRGVIRNNSDWFSYCALAGLDPSVVSPPVDLSKKMILYRSRLSPECLTTTQVLGLDCRSDMLVMSIDNVTDLSKEFTCGFSSSGYFEGYIVDQDPRPVFWLDYNEETGSSPVTFYPESKPVLRPSSAFH